MIVENISKPIAFNFSYSTEIIANTISNIFNIIKIEGLYFDIKPYIYYNSYIFKLKDSRDFIVITYKVKNNSSFLRKVQIKIPIINNVKCNIKYKLILSYFEDTCGNSTLVLLENEIKHFSPLTKLEKEEIEIFKKFFKAAKFEEFFQGINQIITKEDFEINLNASDIINKPLNEVYDYLNDYDNLFNTLNIFQNYEKNLILKNENNGSNILTINVGKDIVKYKIDCIKENDNIIFYYKKTINDKETINNSTCFKIYSLNQNTSLIVCETSLNITYKIYYERFNKLLGYWVRRIKDKLEKI